jgi:hypothetical protein
MAGLPNISGLSGVGVIVRAFWKPVRVNARGDEALQRTRPTRSSSVLLRPHRETMMTDDTAVQARQRGIASEHLLFKLMEYIEDSRPGLLDFLDRSIYHLGDPARDGTKDDEAVRQIARRMILGARKQGVD